MADPIEFYQGAKGNYHWLVSDCCLEDLLDVYPQIVVGKYVAVTALDSGPVRGLTQEEREAGWAIRDEIAYSPKITSVKELFFENSFDEWYISSVPLGLGKRVPDDLNIFSKPLEREQVVPFVNHYVALQDPPDALRADLFWTQMERINPDVYLADNQTHLTIVSADGKLIEECRQALVTLSE